MLWCGSLRFSFVVNHLLGFLGEGFHMYGNEFAECLTEVNGGGLLERWLLIGILAPAKRARGKPL